jgi:hypothetical protein
LSPKQGESYGNPQKPSRAYNELNLNDKVKFLDLLKGSTSLAEVDLVYCIAFPKLVLTIG